MIMKERLSPLSWRASSPDHILGHARLSYIDAELEQLSMDPRCAPQRIGNAHLADQLADLRRHSWPATTASRLPTPVRFEPGAVPFYHGLRLHNRQSVYDSWHQLIQRSKDQAVRGTKDLPLRQMPSLVVKLMAEDQDLS